MNAQEIENILNTLKANKNGHIRGKNNAINKIQRLHLQKIESIINCIPTSWLDPMLTGNRKVISQYPYYGQDIEAVFNELKKRIRNI